MLTFKMLALTSLRRAQKWHHGNIFNPGKPGYWNIAEWGNAAAGEMGEAMGAVTALMLAAGHHMGETCNAAKKLRRLDERMQQAGGDSPAPETIEQAIDKIKKEIGDTVIYLDLCAQSVGVRMEDCVSAAFNRISEREGFPERLPEYGVPFTSEGEENTWRLVETDNFGNDYPDERFLDIFCVGEGHANAIAKALNDGYGPESQRYIKVVRGTYTLAPGFVP